ncbi:MAG: polysaccharide deacetylase family protein [Candidatus Binataceae bacterium]
MADESEMQSEVTTAARLGHAEDARLLMINADDFGMCHDENEATMEGLVAGPFTSATILVTCPWFEEAAEFARANQQMAFGVHLTLTSEWENYKWGPLLGKRAVPSLADGRGYLWADVQSVYANDRLDEAEAELRAQIDRALASGIDVTHLDCHMGPLHLRADYHEVYARLARDYRLPIRVTPRKLMRKMGFGEILERLERDGTAHPDHFYFGGPQRVEETETFWTNRIRELRAGISEIYCHPAYARAELRSCARDAAQREADFRFFTSDKARRLLGDEGVQLINYRTLRDATRSRATAKLS